MSTQQLTHDLCSMILMQYYIPCLLGSPWSSKMVYDGGNEGWSKVSDSPMVVICNVETRHKRGSGINEGKIRGWR
jgi:hypothetical protein